MTVFEPEMPPTYRGKRLSDMSREELEQAVIQLGKTITHIHQQHRENWDWIEELEQARIARQRRRGWQLFGFRH